MLALRTRARTRSAGAYYPPSRYLSGTIDVTNRQIFFVQGAASERLPVPSGAVRTLRLAIVHANRISRQ